MSEPFSDGVILHEPVNVESKAIDENYQFRQLTDTEVLELREIKHDSNQVNLTRSLLSEHDYFPTGNLRIGTKDFLVGPIIKTRNERSRDTAVMYARSDEGRLLPRVFYKSKSDGGWRSSPGINEDSLYSKGNGFHYTQETKPHDHLVRYFEEAEIVGHIVTSYYPAIDEFYFHTNETKPEWHTFGREIGRYDDKGVLSQFQEFPPGNYGIDKLKKDFPLGGAFASFDYSPAALQAFIPDFSLDPIDSSKVRHTLLGPTSLDTYSASLNGRPIKWIMAHDKNGRVWIDRISFTDQEVTSYGVDPEVIDSGALTNKPIEYFQHADALREGVDRVAFEAPYVDITPLLDNLLPIKLYRQGMGVQRTSSLADID